MAASLHAKVTQYIKEGIEGGAYKVGDRIPTENELAALLGVSRPTVRHALGQLTADGRLMRVKGHGTFVTKPKVLHRSASFIASYRAESEKNNLRLETKVLELCVTRLPDKAAKALSLPLGSKGTRLVRLRRLLGYNDSKPVVYTTLYVPLKLFPEMESLDFTLISFYEVMGQRGLAISHATRRLEVSPTPEEVAVQLQISQFEPCIFVSSVGATEGQIAAEYSESYYPAGCSSFLIEVNH